ncbi:MAG TPA: 6,7-dimethyl-8-ribityllumazine synthase [Pyrinomonadaceae bacterium]|jgi:6,7-dimethyl-8-ribityllumazine synthase
MPTLSPFSSFTYTRNVLPTVSDHDDQLLKSGPHPGGANARGFRFAIVASRWNDSLVSRLIEGARDALAELKADEKAIEVFRVPGSFEIPLCALKAAESGKFDAVICLGVIIRGQTPHFEYIAREVTRGIGEAGMKTGVPLLFGVITAENVDQAIDRAGVKLGNKGFEAATAAVELVNLYREGFGTDSRAVAHE